METADRDAGTLREIAATLAEDGYSLTAKVLRDIARRMDTSVATTLPSEPDPQLFAYVERV